MNIHEQIKLFSEASDGLRTDVSNAELEQLGKDIAANAEELWTYHKLIEADAARLSEKAKEYAEAARLQKNKAERVKEYIKYALKTNGFTKFKAGALQFSLSEARKAVAKRPATETDFYTNPELLNVKFSWKQNPNYQMWEELPDFVAPEFTWDVAKLKAEGKEELIDYEITTRLTVKISRET